jgi:hypothetical protein
LQRSTGRERIFDGANLRKRLAPSRGIVRQLFPDGVDLEAADDPEMSKK